MADESVIFVEIRQKNYDRIKELIAEDPSVLEITHNRISPLIVAVQQGDEFCVDLLLELGAPFDPRDTSRDAPLRYAVAYDRGHLVKKFYELGRASNEAKYGSELKKELILGAALHGVSHSLRALYELDNSILRYDLNGYGSTALHNCAFGFSNMTIARTILELDPATLHIKDAKGNLPHFIAFITNSNEQLALMLAIDPSIVDLTNSCGSAAIHCAFVYQNSVGIRLLHKFNSDVYHFTHFSAQLCMENSTYRLYAHVRSLVEVLLLCD